jgi:hypothetical protein
MNEQQPPSHDEIRARNDANMWATFSHLGGLIGTAMPPLNIIIPLVIWLSNRDRFPFVDDQGKEALNFQISITLYAIICMIAVIFVIGILGFLILVPLSIVFSLIATVKASQGEYYRYPLTIRLVK